MTRSAVTRLLIIEFAPVGARMFDGCTMAVVDAEAEASARFTELVAAAGADLTVLPGQQLAEFMRSAISDYAVAA